MFKRKLRFFLHRWHRRLGLAAAVLIVMVSITGVLLNHTGSFQLAKHYPQSAFWLWPYAQDANHGIVLDDVVLQQTVDAVLLNDEPILPCEPPLISAVSTEQDTLWLLCRRNILLLQHHQLIEAIEHSLLGANINHLAKTDHEVVIRDGDQWFVLDTLSMQTGNPVSAPLELPKIDVLPAALQRNHSISWQKIMQDLHSGRFFGDVGVFVIDVAAIILLMLALSGFWIWYSRRK